MIYLRMLQWISAFIMTCIAVFIFMLVFFSKDYVLISLFAIFDFCALAFYFLDKYISKRKKESSEIEKRKLISAHIRKETKALEDIRDKLLLAANLSRRIAMLQVENTSNLQKY